MNNIIRDVGDIEVCSDKELKTKSPMPAPILMAHGAAEAAWSAMALWLRFLLNRTKLLMLCILVVRVVNAQGVCVRIKLCKNVHTKVSVSGLVSRY